MVPALCPSRGSMEPAASARGLHPEPVARAALVELTVLDLQLPWPRQGAGVVVFEEARELGRGLLAGDVAEGGDGVRALRQHQVADLVVVQHAEGARAVRAAFAPATA